MWPHGLNWSLEDGGDLWEIHVDSFDELTLTADIACFALTFTLFAFDGVKVDVDAAPTAQEGSFRDMACVHSEFRHRASGWRGTQLIKFQGLGCMPSCDWLALRFREATLKIPAGPFGRTASDPDRYPHVIFTRTLLTAVRTCTGTTGQGVQALQQDARLFELCSCPYTSFLIHEIYKAAC